MKTIGLIGGMSWESSVEYYRIINEATMARLGGLHSAASVIVSVDFAEIEEMQRLGAWEEAGRAMVRAAQSVEAGGADFVLLCTNTMHKLANEIEAGIHIPFLHIADATGEQVRKCGLRRIGLLGTRFTMEEDFYRGRLREQYGMDVIIPDAEDREVIHRVIYNELCAGQILPASKAAYVAIMARLIAAGAEGIILGCTEIGLLVSQADSAVPLFDTTRIHAEAAVAYAIQGS
jgi:aspartate racemase